MRSASTLFVLFAAMLWGTTGTAQSFAPDGTHPVAFGAFRLCIGGGALLLFSILQKNFSLSGWPLPTLIAAACCMAFYQPFFFSAVLMTGVAVGTVTAIGSAPVIAGLLEWLLYKRIPDRKWWAATFTAITGCVFLFANPQAITVDPVGMLLALGAGTAFATYTIVSKELLNSHPPDTVTAVVFTLAAVLLSPVLFFFDLDWIATPEGLGTGLYIGVIATAFAYLLFARGLQGIKPSTAVTLSLAEPMTAALLGVAIVGETLSLLSWTGVCLLMMSIVILSIQRKTEAGI
ncbi:transport protein YwfM [Jeotgalibacillus alimentarius]|uniref:Transport protein YwfM n=1 Tax=Jeotgalibacillus alimentarius TaxID=135826 RepID=A0A0C2W5E0_9BACL|nr:EamA family transporter [Jeotgalibacillus alimentarius]KIL51248.1 transport protein YwfM [Jeotgalibacillus alimentarius]